MWRLHWRRAIFYSAITKRQHVSPRARARARVIHAHVVSMHNACVMYAHRSARILRAHCLRTMTRKPALTTISRGSRSRLFFFFFFLESSRKPFSLLFFFPFFASSLSRYLFYLGIPTRVLRYGRALKKARLWLQEGRDYDLGAPILFTSISVVGFCARSAHFFLPFPRPDFLRSGSFLYASRVRSTVLYLYIHMFNRTTEGFLLPFTSGRRLEFPPSVFRYSFII